MGFLDRFRQQQPTSPAPDSADGFGRKLTWVAVRTTDRDAVVAALGVVDAQPATWSEAVDAAYEGRLLVTPPLAGVGGHWVLAAGDDLDECLERLPVLSTQLGTEVQYFATHRVSGYSCWARAVDGRLVRAFERGDGELLRWVGAPGEVEIGAGLDQLERWLEMDEDQVGEVADGWSLCPYDRALTPADGQPLVGELD